MGRQETLGLYNVMNWMHICMGSLQNNHQNYVSHNETMYFESNPSLLATLWCLKHCIFNKCVDG